MEMSHSFTLSSNIYWKHLWSTSVLLINIASTTKIQLLNWGTNIPSKLQYFNTIINNTILLNIRIVKIFKSLKIQSIVNNGWGRKKKTQKL